MARRISEDALVKLGDFSGGVENTKPESAAAPNTLRKAQNVDLVAGPENRSALRRRQGFTQVLAATQPHSIKGHNSRIYYVSDGELRSVSADGHGVRTERTGMDSSPVAYCEIGANLFYSNGKVNGHVANGSHQQWGVEVPAQPTLSRAAVGGLTAGRYQVALTFSRKGEESGAYDAVQVAVEEGEGITLSNIPTPSDPDVDTVNVYASQPDGDVLYWRMRLSAGTSSAQLFHTQPQKQISTQFSAPPPPSTSLCIYNGRVWGIAGTLAWFSEAMAFGRTRLQDNHFQLLDDGVFVANTIDGVYVATKSTTHFFGGTDPKQMTFRDLMPFGAVPGSLTYAPAKHFANVPDNLGLLPVWWTTDSRFAVGLPGGEVQLVKDEEFALPSFESAATLFREIEGAPQILSALKNPKQSHSNLAVRDELAIEVRKL